MSDEHQEINEAKASANTDAGQSSKTSPWWEDTPENRRNASVMELATIIAGSRDFPACRTPEKAAVRIMAGREIGIGPIAAVDGIRIENGKICVSAAIMESVVDRSDVYDWKQIERDSQHCSIEFFRRGDSRGIIDYTMDNARTAGLLAKKGDNWTKHPEAMLFAAAFRTGARAYCAGAFNGNAVYTFDELGIATDDDGNAINQDDGGNEGGSDLCTREQRIRIQELAKQIGKPLPSLIKEQGIRILDELSGWEAGKLIKKLEKQSAKNPPSPEASPAEPPMPSAIEQSSQSSADSPSPAQATMTEAFDESRKPILPDQQDAILGLAGFLEPDENARCEWMVAVLAKRNCEKVSELNHLQAAALIESMQAALKQKKEDDARAKSEKPPFVPTN
ncbi:hypothetical protein [Trichococcus shcherbakoviae]|uniref:hypothetical protein n=1 Tax=Trichococcus shcherbakoviae TaxID=2094020 RepID=UPI002AA7A6EA|nr:hypothetical protein [Trichococcus shcherbakoviae]